MIRHRTGLVVILAMFVFLAIASCDEDSYEAKDELNYDIDSITIGQCSTTYWINEYVVAEDFETVYLPVLVLNENATKHFGTPAVVPANEGADITVSLTVSYWDFLPPGEYPMYVLVYDRADTYVKPDSFSFELSMRQWQNTVQYITVPHYSAAECEYSGECDYAIALDTSGVELNPHECAFISGVPAMPDLVAYIEPLSGLAGMIEWDLLLTYNRSDRNDTSRFSAFVPATNAWDIGQAFYDSAQFCGGQATLTARIVDQDCLLVYSFGIRGLNPDTMSIVDLISEHPYFNWYAVRVAAHEGGVQDGRRYLQFNEEYTYDCLPTDVRYTPNSNASTDGGMGVFQVTNVGNTGRGPTINEMWDWRANCSTGVWWLNEIQETIASPWMNSQRTQALVETGTSIPVPDTTVGNVFFSDNSYHTMEHAVALKRFNGASLGHYCYWDNDAVSWGFNPLNSNGIDYVTIICSLSI